MSNNHRVVVTGLALNTSLGDELDFFWQDLVQGKSGISWDHEFNLPLGRIQHVRKKGSRLETVYQETFQKVFSQTELSNKRIGITVSSSKGNFPQNIYGTRLNKIQAPSINLSTACATGLQSIEWAMRWIQMGYVDVVIAGGAECILTPFWIQGYKRLGILAKAHQNDKADEVLKPFSKGRSGTVLGEGCGLVVLESLDHARENGSHIFAEILSYSNVSDPYHFSDMNPNSISYALDVLLKKAQVKDIQYINLHGNGTKSNDRVETQALKKTFGSDVYDISMSSSKPATGHMIGASGAVEFIITVLTLMHQEIAPTLNLNEPDSDCDLDYTPLKSCKRNINHAITLSYGMGGHISAVLLKKVPSF